jgi:L-iditol 2-dehydrogenase
MREIVLTGIRQMLLHESPAPEIRNDHDVLIRNYYSTGKIGSQIVEYPFRIGHECAGIVEKVGQGVSGLRAGDLVAIDPSVSCGICAECLRGRPHTCLNNQFLGCPGQLPGCLAEYIVMPAENCFRVAGMSMAEAAFVEPLTIGYYTAQFLKNELIKTVAILGVGSIGMSVLLAAKANGIREIFVTDILDYRNELAKQMGVIWAGNSTCCNVFREITVPVDAVIECCGDQEALDDAIELVRPGGTVLIVGIPEENRVSFDAHKMRRKEITLQNVRRQNGCTPAAIALIEQGKVDIKPLITHHFPLEETRKAFELVEGYRDHVLKAIIQVN